VGNYFTESGKRINIEKPIHGRIAELIQRYPVEYMILGYTSKFNDKIFFRKAAHSS